MNWCIVVRQNKWQFFYYFRDPTNAVTYIPQRTKNTSKKIFTEKTHKVCIIGYPVSHSLSPLLHNYWLNKYKISGEYSNSEVKPDDIESHLINLSKNGFIGANITIPHKRAAIKTCSEISNTARRVGAVNTLITKPGGKLGVDRQLGSGELHRPLGHGRLDPVHLEEDPPLLDHRAPPFW